MSTEIASGRLVCKHWLALLITCSCVVAGTLFSATSGFVRTNQIQITDAYNQKRIGVLIEEIQARRMQPKTALEELRRINASLDTAAPAFTILANNEDPVIRILVFDELGRFAIKQDYSNWLAFKTPFTSKKLSPELLICADRAADSLNHPDPEVKYSAALSLVYLNPRDSRALAVLLEFAAGRDFGSSPRDIALTRVLGFLDPGNKPISKYYRGYLDSSDPGERLVSAGALGSLHDVASVEDLTTHLKDSDPAVRKVCAIALSKISSFQNRE